MKRTVILFIIAALVLISTLVWILSGTGGIKPVEFLNLGVIVVLIGFALFIGYKRLSSVKKGEPAEDEMSKKVMQKTAAFSYYISIYLWLVIMYFSDRFHYEMHTIIGAGILGMAVIFGICWLVINFTGIRNG